MRIADNKELVEQLNLEETLKTIPNILTLTTNSMEKAVWRCKKHGDYIQSIYYRYKGYCGCRECDYIRRYAGRTEYLPQLDIYDEVDIAECNRLGIRLDKIAKSNNKIKIAWRCRHNHLYMMTVHSRNNGGYCQICNRRKPNRPDSIALQRPDLVKFFDSNKNEYSAYEIGVNSLDNVYWICANGHEVYSSPHTQNSLEVGAKNIRCPMCSGRLRITGVNDFATLHKDIIDEWDYENNEKIGLDPCKLPDTGDIKAYWICRRNKNHRWSSTLTIRGRGSGCPICSKGRQVSTQEIAIKEMLSIIDNTASNRNRIDGLEYDVKSDKYKLLIEYNGMAWHNIEMSDRDKLKAMKAKEIGYELIVIREYRDNLDDRIVFTKNEGFEINNDKYVIHTLYFNIKDGYKHFKVLLKTIIKLIDRAFNIGINIENIDYNNIIKYATEYIEVKPRGYGIDNY